MDTTLIVYSTTDGHTRRICEHVKRGIEQTGGQATLVSIDEAESLAPSTFDRIVIGASIRYGRHNPKVANFIRRHRTTLQDKPSGLFSVNLVARKPEKSDPATNPYMRRFLREIPWKPRLAAVFAGKLDYPIYGPVDRLVIRLIMRLTGGPTDPTSVVEFTDWQKVDAFVLDLLALH